MKNEKWEHVTSTLDMMREQSDRLAVVYDAIGLQPDSVLCDAQGKIEQAVIEGLEMLIGDVFQTISWYVYDNDYGRKNMKAGLTGHLRKIKSVNRLRWLIDAQGNM